MRLAIVALLLSFYLQADAPTMYRIYMPVMLNQSNGMTHYIGGFTPLPLDPPIPRTMPDVRPTMAVRPPTVVITKPPIFKTPSP